MKLQFETLTLCVSFAFSINSQTLTQPQTSGALPDLSTWPVIARDRCSTTREFVQNVPNSITGPTALQTNRVTVVAGGMNYIDSSGLWQESKDLIELTSDGGAAAIHSPIKVYFSPSLGTESDPPITLITFSNQVFQTRPLGIYFFDPVSGKEALLATPQQSVVAELQPPNRILYRSAFQSDILKASLRITCTKAAMESDIIITRKPKVSPASFSMNPSTTLLQCRHLWTSTSAPRLVTKEIGPGLVDQGIDFGDMLFVPGKAFAWDGVDPEETNSAAQISFLNTVEEHYCPDVEGGPKHFDPCLCGLDEGSRV